MLLSQLLSFFSFLMNTRKTYFFFSTEDHVWGFARKFRVTDLFKAEQNTATFIFNKQVGSVQSTAPACHAVTRSMAIHLNGLQPRVRCASGCRTQC